jgi:LemA protein
MTYLVLIGCAIVVAWAVAVYNRLVRDRNRVETAWSDIDVQLKRRYDLIPKLVAAVEQYARYEQSTLQTVIEIRRQASRVEGVDAKAPLEKQLAAGLGKLIALVESYPELKADRNFLQLQNDLTDVENHIQYARRFYNGAVRNLNTRIDSFPDLMIARPLGFRPKPFFELDSEGESQPPELSL